MISIIMPTYNRVGMMKQAIESILRQTYKNIEIVIIDDNSSDDTEITVKELVSNGCNILYYKNANNMGPGYNRNKGYCLSRGEYIVFMDDDDYYTDNTFYEKAISILDSDKGIACVSANAWIENVRDQSVMSSDIGFEGKKNGEEYLLGLNKQYHKPLSTFASVFSRKYLNQAELGSMKMVNDIAIYMRALVFGDIYVIGNCIGNYRVHGSNISARIEKDFLINNMEERLWTAKRFKCNLETVNQWLNEQLLFCFSYYIRGTHPTVADSCSIVLWIVKNTKISFGLYKGILRILIKERKKNLH